MEIQNILIAGKLANAMKEQINADAYRQEFRFKPAPEVTVDDLQWADAYVSFEPTANFDFYNLKWVHSFGAGVNPYVYNREWKQDVLLTRTVCSFGSRISQYCLSYYLKDMQEHDYFRAHQNEKKWQPKEPQLINGQKVMVYGTGEIGQEVAKIFSTIGMDVVGVSLSGKQKDYFRDVYAVSTETEELHDADLVINTLPLTDSTEQLFGEEFFTRLTHAVFINVGRGSSIVDDALLRALDDGRIRLAVLDVFREEPLPKGNRLWNHENVLITPHISAVTTVEEAAECFLDTLNTIENNGVLHNKVDVTRGY
ncbi:D-2-hydroxyacid dehydrogenase [Aquibacillus sediminis]|uniref:D-2-hydroxyacid dehydrogenase n=1 Tax=Aquibacillus sediminis TaxID=2574734 RepID=UPI0011082F35|nr:D-2-hydroxyacid dehydrogenase [Aquibacillus sediminis]